MKFPWQKNDAMRFDDKIERINRLTRQIIELDMLLANLNSRSLEEIEIRNIGVFQKRRTKLNQWSVGYLFFCRLKEKMRTLAANMKDELKAELEKEYKNPY